MSDILRYTRGDELEPVSITWYEPDGTLYDFTTGWTFRARIGTGAGFLVEKTSGFTGAATAPNLSINFTAGELDGVASGTYHIDIRATLTATGQDVTRTWLFQILAGVGTDTLPQSPSGFAILGDLSVDGEIFVGGLPLPELSADDPGEVGLVTTAGVTLLALLDTVARHAHRHVAGQYYWSVLGTSAPATLVQDTLVLMPVWLTAGTLDRIGVDVSTAQASGVIRLGVYSETAGLPSARIAEAASTADASTPGIKDLTITAAIPKNGRYWLACVGQGAAGIQIQGGPSTGPASGLPLPLGTTVQGGTTNFLSRIQGSQSGALPATVTVTGTPNSSRARWHFRYA